MKFHFTLWLLLITSILSAQETLRKFVYFTYNSSELTTEGKATLDQMLADVAGKKIQKIELYGHTDSDGDESANMILSQQRVSSVKQYLVGKGTPAGLFTTEAFGESQPALPNTTEHGKETNRRVEIAFTYDEATTGTVSFDFDDAVIDRVSCSCSAIRRLPLNNIIEQLHSWDHVSEYL